MQIAFALLTDHVVHNYSMQLCFEATGGFSLGLPPNIIPHVKIKAPFEINDNDLVKYREAFFEFCKKFQPMPLVISKASLFRTPFPVLYLDIEKDFRIQEMHAKLLEEMTTAFQVSPSGFDGVGRFHFHLTLALGGSNVKDYERALGHYRNKIVNHTFIAKNAALLVNNAPSGAEPTWWVFAMTELKET